MKFIRVLAIHPSTGVFGFAVLEEPEELIDWGMRTIKGDKNARCVQMVSDLIEHYQPDALVVEDCWAKGSRRCLRIQELIQDLLNLATGKKIKARSYPRLSVGKIFAPLSVPTKYQMANMIVSKFPELAPQLPPIRKPWMKEDDRMSIFAAMALALTLFVAKGRRYVK